MTSPAATVDYKPWFERWPDLKADEKKRFEAHGLPWAEDLSKWDGYLTVFSEVEFEGRPLKIEIVYPAEYPELPPYVSSKEVVLDRHQMPFSGNFCLLERPIDSWVPGSWGAADLIHCQLRKLLRDSEAGPEAVRSNEAPIPEPATAFFEYAQGASVLVPGNLASPPGDGGRIELRQLGQGRFVLTELDEMTGYPQVLNVLNGSNALAGTWARLGQHPPEGPGGQQVLEWVERTHPSLVKKPAPPPPPKQPNRRRFGAPPLQIVGFVFPEERDAEGNERDSWLFLGVATENREQNAFLLHAQEVSEDERQRRIRHIDGLTDKRVALIGLGSLGGDIALHLARANVGQLDLVDFDRFEANNSVRHSLGITSAGLDKTSALKAACEQANPFCEGHPHHRLKLGDITPEPPLKRLEEIVSDADIVVETTGIQQIELLVGRVAWDAGVPLISCWLTHGSWAGEVVRLEQGRTMCMSCFQTAQEEKRAMRGDEAPEREGTVSAQGCSHPTTVGAGFDAGEVAAMASRLIVQTLLKKDSYPEPDWDHAVANFRSSSDDRFATEVLSPNEKCRECAPIAG